MKLQKCLFLAFVLTLSFISCEKEETSIKTTRDTQEKEQENNDELPYSETVRVFTEDGTEYADILTSATNQKILDHHLSEYSYVVEVNKDFNTLKSGSSEELTIEGLPENEAEDLPEEMVCFEIIEASTDVKNISLSFEKNETTLKSTPPSKYFRVYKEKSNIRVTYNPIASDPNGIIFKWGYTKCWICKWHWDSKWRWIQGHIWFEHKMEHPLNNNSDVRRIGFAVYTNNLNNFTFETF